jgi:hypothetical protein
VCLWCAGKNPKEVLDAARVEGAGRKACLLVQHGRLIGYLPGEEPLPFVTGPRTEPIIEESFAKQVRRTWSLRGSHNNKVPWGGARGDHHSYRGESTSSRWPRIRVGAVTVSAVPSP